MAQSKTYLQLAEIVFYYVMALKFPEIFTNKQSVLQHCKTQIKSLYILLIGEMLRVKQAQLERLFFVMTYVIHKRYFEIFSHDRDRFSLR